MLVLKNLGTGKYLKNFLTQGWETTNVIEDALKFLSVNDFMSKITQEGISGTFAYSWGLVEVELQHKPMYVTIKEIK